MSLNPGMEQDFRDTIKRCNELVLLCRRGINEAASGDKANITITLGEMAALGERITDVTDCGRDCFDTFTDKDAPEDEAAA